MSSALVVLLLSISVSADPIPDPNPNLGHDGPSNDPELSHLDADDPDFSGVVDFSNAVPGPGGSWCITKMKYVEHMVKDQVRASADRWFESRRHTSKSFFEQNNICVFH